MYRINGDELTLDVTIFVTSLNDFTYLTDDHILREDGNALKEDHVGLLLSIEFSKFLLCLNEYV